MRPAALKWAKIALGLGIVATVGFAAISVFTTTTNGGGKFQHTADYWYTASAIPIAIAEMLLLFSIHAIQDRKGGRLATFGVGLTNIALVMLTGMLISSVSTGSENSWGPSYVLATLATFVGHALFSVGSWRISVFPRWVLGAWPLVWVIGSFAATGASPLLLTALYGVMAVLLGKRSTT
jgi:hypothetical protein